MFLHSAWKSNQKNSSGRFVWLGVIFKETKGLGGAGALVLQSEHELVAFLVEEIDDDDGAVAIEKVVEVEIEEGPILQAMRWGGRKEYSEDTDRGGVFQCGGLAPLQRNAPADL